MRTSIAFLFILALLLQAAPAPAEDLNPKPKAQDDLRLVDGVAAQVNNHAITVGEVMQAVSPARQRIAATSKTKQEFSERMKTEFNAALNALIDRKLILDAFKSEDGQLPDWAVQRRQEEIIREQFGDDFSRLQTALQNDDMTMEQWSDVVRERMIVQSMRSAKVNSAVRINTLDVRRHYDTHIEKYRIPSRVRLRMIVLNKHPKEQLTKKRALAQSVQTRIMKGQSFETLAREISEGDAADKGGDWGWLNPAELRPELAHVATKLPARSISEVIETDDDLYILYVEKKQKGGVTPFEEVARSIERQLRSKQGERIYSTWTKSLRKNAFIKIFDIQAF
ncbi:MAG: peptidyl-prolyl cis-trans isomerase [Kiritimatiellae bacterium]|nr:peptidyl-prolyl cis-trans isomerase [Kiritimatiellia bacterium]